MADVAGAKGSAEGTVRQAAESRPARMMVRAGILAYGLTHVLVAWLALQVAFGDSRQRADQSGAFQTLAQGGLGRALLWVLVVGFAAVVIWRVSEALTGFRYRERAQRIRGRLESAGKAVVFAVLAVLAARTAVSGSGGSGSGEAAAGVLGWPGGQWLVGAVGVGIVVVAVVMGKHGWECTFTNDMNLPLDARARQVAVRTGQVGSVAKAVVTALVGVLVVLAAVRFRPEEANGLDAALKTLAAQPLGTVLLVLVAVGLAAFGVFCVFDARYHRV